MNRILKKSHIPHFVIALLVLLSSCAQQGQPSGGPKDIAPPKVLETNPADQNTNFIGKKIIFTFDEYMQIQDASSQFFISPPLKNLPEFTIRKKSLIVTFGDTLLPNTTYNINFGESIKDINEGNVLDNLTYAFSTGPYIDSLSITGTVKDAFDHKTEKGVLIMAYDTEVDSMPMKKLPTYYAKCDDNGKFTLSNLKDGKYKLIALKDKNSNLLFDLPEEEAIGFIDTLVTPVYVPKPVVPDTTANDSVAAKKASVKKDTLAKENKPALELLTFMEEKPVQYLKKSYSPENYKVVFVYNAPVQKIDVHSLNQKIDHEWMFREFGEKRDTVSLWLFLKGQEKKDTLILEVHTDTLKTDTVEIALNATGEPKTEGKGASKKASKPTDQKFELSLSAPGAGKAQHPKKGFEIKFNHPVVMAEMDSVILKEDEDTIKFTTSSDHPALRNFYIHYDWKAGKKYNLLIKPNTFKDFYQLQNDTFQTSFTAGTPEDYGNLMLSVGLPEGGAPHILQLLNDKDKVVEEKVVTKSELITFALLSPGSYKLKMIVDENANGKWDTGNYLQQRQAESIILYTGPAATIRANWDLELEWQPYEP